MHWVTNNLGEGGVREVFGQTVVDWGITNTFANISHTIFNILVLNCALFRNYVKIVNVKWCKSNVDDMKRCKIIHHRQTHRVWPKILLQYEPQVSHQNK